MDFQILYFINEFHFEILDKIMILITHMGTKGIFWILVGVILLLFKKTRKCGLTVLIALLFSLIVGNILLKNIVARPRPCWIDETINMLIAVPKDYSFPSGHTFASFAAAVSVFLYYKKAGIAAVILAFLIGFSRLYLFVHFPTDVLSGAVLGICAAFASRCIVNKIWQKIKI